MWNPSTTRLWNNALQIAYHSLYSISVNVGGHVIQKKSLCIPAITNPASLSSPQSLCLCLSHSLSLSHKPPPSHARPSLPIFSLCLQSCVLFYHSLSLYIGSFSLMPALSVLWHPPRRSWRGLGAFRVATGLFVDVGPGQLSSTSSVFWLNRSRKKYIYNIPVLSPATFYWH